MWPSGGIWYPILGHNGMWTRGDEDFTWSISIRVKNVKVRKLNFFRSLCTYVNIFSYSSKNIRVSGGGPGACLQNMEGETTLEYLGGGQGRSIDGFELHPPPNDMP